MGQKTQQEEGFTLIELLVVIVIMAILVAIAIPVFMHQREKAWVAQSQAALRDAATAIESYAVEAGGTYSGVDGQCRPSSASACSSGDDTILVGEGYKKAPGVKVEVRATASTYCVIAIHDSLDPSPPPHDWWVSTWHSEAPGPSDDDSCPGF